MSRPTFMVKHVTERKGGEQKTKKRERKINNKKQTEVSKLSINKETVRETTPLPSTAELCS